MAKTATTLEGEKSAILALVAAGDDEHWQIGVHYNRIVDQQLAQAAGYATAAEFLAKELHEISQATLTQYGAIAKAFTEAQARRHGVSKLGLLLTYERLTRAKAPKDRRRERAHRGDDLDDGVAKISDFGIARAPERPHARGDVTLPEQSRQRAFGARMLAHRAASDRILVGLGAGGGALDGLDVERARRVAAGGDA